MQFVLLTCLGWLTRDRQDITQIQLAEVCKIDSMMVSQVIRLMEKKRLGDPIVMVTAYDYPSARAAEAAGVDLVLVGDSAATTVLGYSATTPVRTFVRRDETTTPRAPNHTGGQGDD